MDILDQITALWNRDLSYDEWYDLSRDMWPDIIAEIGKLRSAWRQEHATAETWKEDCKKAKKVLVNSELFRQAQYNQIAAKDARIVFLEADQKRYHEQWMAAEEDKEKMVARIKELLALNENLMENGNDLRSRCQKAEELNKKLEPGFLDVYVRWIYQEHVRFGMTWTKHDETAACEKACAALEELRGNDL